LRIVGVFELLGLGLSEIGFRSQTMQCGSDVALN